MRLTLRQHRQHREAREAREAELARQDREAASRLAGLAPAPVFPEAGRCPDCDGSRFCPLETAGEAAARGFLAGGLAGAAVAASQGFTECVTCGKVFRKG